MVRTTETTPTTPLGASGQPASPAANASAAGVNARLVPPNPNAPPAEEVVAATFPSISEAERTVEELVAAGIARGDIVLLSDTHEKRNYMKRFVHRDGDRHTHGGTAAAFSALIGALALGLIAVATVSQYMPEGFGPIGAALLGGLLGAVLGGILGGVAFRTADDSSMEIVESVAADGTLVAIQRVPASNAMSLDQAGRILERHNGRAMRLRHQIHQADLHPGDTRTRQNK